MNAGDIRRRGEEAIPRLFALDDAGTAFRVAMRKYARIIVCALLGGLTLVPFFFLAQTVVQRLTVLVLSLVVYIPLFEVSQKVARYKAADYLSDIYELDDETVADSFLQEVAFGKGVGKIVIEDGTISEKDEESPVIQVGGPGFIQVNLDNVALMERADGSPEIIYPREKAWKMSSFARLREIGESDEAGQRQFAIVSLRDQKTKISVRSRTKDGIPLEARNVEILFGLFRKPEAQASDANPHHLDESAICALVYNQAVVYPAPKPSGVSFPWDTTVIPLIAAELEEIISSHTLSELLATVSYKEVDDVNEGETENQTLRFEMTGEQTAASGAGVVNPPNFESRSKITARFYSPEFKEKAAQLGVVIHWIDIGTWKFPSELIFKELKSGWEMRRENARRRSQMNRLAKRQETQELRELVASVIVNSFERANSGRDSRSLSDNDVTRLSKVIHDNPAISFSPAIRQQIRDSAPQKNAATEILKAFRKELIAARELIQKENRSPVNKQIEIARIDKALRDIDHHLFHFIGG
ncbi:MAG: hypothetical protein LC099_03000 [Anaerolineales bacterium]|nr:hypothetical protein [Anaerolineales bacterium]